jgi:hypothetical protein
VSVEELGNKSLTPSNWVERSSKSSQMQSFIVNTIME